MTTIGTPPSTKSLIIFDWDGTLMDSIGLIVESIHHAGKQLGYAVSDTEAKSIIGLSLEAGIDILYPTASVQQRQQITQHYVDYYIAHATNSPLFDGIHPMITGLHSQGKQLAVATGKKRKGLERVYAHSGIQSYFVTSRCADESGSKPDPAMLNEILAETNTAVEAAIFIGDSIHDIKMANAIGMDSIAVNYGCESAAVLAEQSPTYQVDTVAELQALLVT